MTTRPKRWPKKVILQLEACRDQRASYAAAHQRLVAPCPGCGKPTGWCLLEARDRGLVCDSAGRYWHGACAQAALAGLPGVEPEPGAAPEPVGAWIDEELARLAGEKGRSWEVSEKREESA